MLSWWLFRRACGAVGSALPWHGRGREFESHQVHQTFQSRTAPCPPNTIAGIQRESTTLRADVKAPRRYNGYVSRAKRATVYFEPGLHKALRIKAAHTDTSLSELVNASVRRTLAEDAEDLATFERRAKEPALSFEEVLKDMKRRGKL